MRKFYGKMGYTEFKSDRPAIKEFKSQLFWKTTGDIKSIPYKIVCLHRDGTIELAKRSCYKGPQYCRISKT